MPWLGTDVIRKNIRNDLFISSLAKEINNPIATKSVISVTRFDLVVEYSNINSCTETGNRMLSTKIGKYESTYTF